MQRLKTHPLLLAVAGCLLPIFLTKSLAQNDKSLQDSIQKLHDLAISEAPTSPENAFLLAEKSLEMSLSAGFRKGELRSYYCFGLASYYKGYFVVSNDYYRIITRAPESDEEQKSAAWNNMGINFEMLEQYDSSLFAYQESMKLDKALGDRKSEHMVLINTGLLNFNLHRMDSAFSQTYRALRFFSHTPDVTNQALCYLNLGLYFEETGKKDSALVNNIRAEHIYEQTEDFANLVITYNNQMNILLEQNNFGRAKEVYQKAQRASEKVDGLYHVAVINSMGANYFLQTQHYDSALVHQKACNKIYEELEVNDGLVDGYLFLAKIYAEAGKVPEFRAAIARYDSLNVKRNIQELTNRLAEMEVKYQLDSKNTEIKTGLYMLQEQKKFIILISICALVLLVGLVKTYSLYAEVKAANRHLYEKNIELMEKPAAEETQNLQTAGPRTEENALLAKFQQLLTQRELFKNPELSLKTAAQELGTNEKYLSQAINADGNDNFNTYVNRFRVNEARRLILEGKYNEISIEELGMMAGFSNRHTFSRAFTQLAGISPSVFRKIHLQNLESRA